jgi:hypothetical protein
VLHLGVELAHKASLLNICKMLSKKGVSFFRLFEDPLFLGKEDMNNTTVEAWRTFYTNIVSIQDFFSGNSQLRISDVCDKLMKMSWCYYTSMTPIPRETFSPKLHENCKTCYQQLSDIGIRLIRTMRNLRTTFGFNADADEEVTDVPIDWDAVNAN